jgi:hypothetical protein
MYQNAIKSLLKFFIFEVVCANVSFPFRDAAVIGERMYKVWEDGSENLKIISSTNLVL